MVLIIIIIIAVAICIFLKRRDKRRSSPDRQAEHKLQETTSARDIPEITQQRTDIPSSNEAFYSFTIDKSFPDSYTAIDVETATSSTQFICQIGIVQVDEGNITEERVFLIQPPENKYDVMTSVVHGITPEHTKDAPTFREVWQEIRPMLEGRYVVAHNASFDSSALNANLDHYGIPHPDLIGFGCTCVPFGNVSLHSAAVFFGIETAKHHDALADARTCALLVQEYKRHFGETLRVPKVKEKPARTVSKANKGWADDLEQIPDNYFKGKTIVITGTFARWPDRDELAAILKGFGARVTGSVSKKTSIVVVGEGAGPSKLDKIGQLLEEGIAIETLSEEKISKLIDEIERSK